MSPGIEFGSATMPVVDYFATMPVVDYFAGTVEAQAE